MATTDPKPAQDGDKPDARPHRPGDVSFLEQALWKMLSDANSSSERMFAWLSLLAASVEGARAGVVVLKQDGEFAPAATWPADMVTEGTLSAAAEKALQSGRGVVLPHPRASADMADIAFPLQVDGELRGVVALTVANAGGDAANKAFRQLQWSAAWVREILLGTDLEKARHVSGKATSALKLFAVALEEERMDGACRSLVTQLAEQFGCERVSIGFERRGRIKVSTISHTAEFSEKLNLSRLLGEAMDEAVDQHAYIVYPPAGDEPVAVRAHEILARKHLASAILTLPIFAVDRFLGAITFERTGEGARFTPGEIDSLEFIAACLGPILLEKQANDRPLIAKAASSFVRQLTALLGPRHIGRKLFVLAAAMAATYFYYATTVYRVAADARIEGSVQRTIAAPFEGLIRDVAVRPGDVVEPGAMLVAFDDRELVLERLRWVTERDRQRAEYDRALGDRNRADARIIQARIEQANAQIELTNEKLARTVFRAPFQGVVISGDLSQRIGDVVRRGEALMQIAPLTSYRVILNVDEGQIEHIAVGQAGELVVSSLPDVAFPIRVTKIIPASSIVNGKNVFVAEAEVSQNSDRLRPGMKGVSKVDAGERLLIWVWTRPFIDWLRLFVWQWIP
jgi:multidrug efflux pump subunit AcrA (membrane-fusion protein)